MVERALLSKSLPVFGSVLYTVVIIVVSIRSGNSEGPFGSASALRLVVIARVRVLFFLYGIGIMILLIFVP